MCYDGLVSNHTSVLCDNFQGRAQITYHKKKKKKYEQMSLVWYEISSTSTCMCWRDKTLEISMLYIYMIFLLPQIIDRETKLEKLWTTQDLSPTRTKTLCQSAFISQASWSSLRSVLYKYLQFLFTVLSCIGSSWDTSRTWKSKTRQTCPDCGRKKKKYRQNMSSL